MTSKAKKKVQKTKAREKRKHNKILAERERLRAPARAERAERRRNKRIEKLQKDLDAFTYMSTESLEILPDDALAQLEKNAQILKALEQEYVGELETKKQLNEKLEADGHLTLEDKMRAMQNVDRPQEIGICGGADCLVGPPPVETADVEVVQAPDLEKVHAAKQKVLAMNDSVSVGITRVGEAYGLKVNTETEMEFPSEIDGVPVVVEVVGKLEKQNS